MDLSIDSPAAAVRHHVNGVTLHCVEAGPPDGPLVILLHGFPEFWWGWRRQIGALADAGFRVIAPDQRGYNLSDKPEGIRAYVLDTLAGDVIGLVEALGRESCHVVGHDWGGLVAWWAASRHPERIAKLVAINAPHPSVVGPYMRSRPLQIARSSYIGFFQVPFLPEWLLSAGRHRLLKESLRRTSRQGTFSEEDLARYERTWSQPGALTAMLNWYRALPLFQVRSSQPEHLSMPVLAIWGMGDRFLEKGLAEASLRLCRNGEAAFIENATHWVHLEAAERVNAALTGFLKR